MDSDEEFLYESDSGNESSDDGFSSIIPVSEMGDNPVSDKNEDDFPYWVLTTVEILEHMVECIKEVNVILQVSQKPFYCFHF